MKQFLEGNIQYLGAVPQDSALEKAVRQQKPVSITSPNAKSAEAFSSIANRIINGKEESANTKWGIIKMFNKFINR